jgi:beta-glucosidase
MIKKIILFLSLLSFCAMAVPTVIDTVVVPIKYLKCVEVTGNLSYYVGKTSYDLHVGDNDSLNISLTFAPVGTGTAVVVDSVKGDVGTHSLVNGINGTNDIYFWCHIDGTPAAQYRALVTIVANASGLETQTNALVAQMTNGEKAQQCCSNGNREYPDLSKYGGIPGLYMANGTSGPCQLVNGYSTSFPTGAAMTCTFDTALMCSVGTAVAQEFWAKGHYMIEAPMVNMVIDPRGGRNWETFGEDPYLSARLSVAYCVGAQKLNCIITPKHMVLNDREDNRILYSSNISERPLRENYCMPFEYTVKEGKAWCVMSAYNQVNGIYTAASSHLLTDILKNGWGFRGFTISDWGAMNHNTAAECANAGQDVELPDAVIYGQLANAVPGQVSQARLDDMARRVIRTKVWAGVIGKLGTNATTKYTTTLMSQNHKDLALQTALKSIVLVKNATFGTPAAPALPLDSTKTVAVVGSYYNQCRQWGVGAIASGKPCPDLVTPGIQVAPDAGVSARAGTKYMAQNWQAADQVVVVVGVSGEAENQDRNSLYITPANTDNALVASVIAAGKKCIVVMTGGSPAVQEGWSSAHAVLVEWYGGQAQGTALAQILYGDVNPSGRLSASFPANASQLPDFLETNNIVQYENYTNDFGRGYRYYDQKNLVPLYAFGFGLSYTTFQYGNLTINPSELFVGQFIVSVDIQNTGTRSGEEVAELYIHPNNPPKPRPVKELRGFQRVSLTPGQTKTVSFLIRERELAYFDDATGVNKFVVAPGAYTILVGPSSYAGQPLTAFPVTGTLTVQ